MDSAMIACLQKAYNNLDKVFFTSDTHFGHANIIRLCKRPFSNVEEMNESLINNWNKVVPNDGIVFHLGDFAFGGPTLWKEIRSRLNGSIVLISGNHDMHNWKPANNELFAAVADQVQLKIPNSNHIYLNHYPFLCYGGSYKGDNAVWQLFGHVHTSSVSSGLDSNRMTNLFPTQYDVGVDNNNFTPVSYKQICEIINKQRNGSIG